MLKGLARIMKWTTEERNSRELYAVQMGYSVSYSTYAQVGQVSHNNYRLDYPVSSLGPAAWCPSFPDGSWIQVNSG